MKRAYRPKKIQLVSRRCLRRSAILTPHCNQWIAMYSSRPRDRSRPCRRVCTQPQVALH